MKQILLLGLVLVLGATAVARADRAHVRYIGLHPVAKSHGGGTCYIEGPHVHVYPADKLQYREHRGHHYFIGDPVAYGYDGPRHAYKGHHPIHVYVNVGSDEPDVEYCYLDGAHYHAFAPPPGPEFRIAGGAYFFVGKPPRAYVEARPAMVRINAVYRPLVYARPVVTVAAPAGWIGAHVVVAPPVVHVPRPGVRVDIDIGIPGVVIYERHHHRRHHKHKKWRKHRHRRRW